MDPKIRQIRRDRWLQIILAAGNSGMTKKQWCREHQISTKTFYHWQKIIREEEAERFQQMSLTYTPGNVSAPETPGLSPVTLSASSKESILPALSAFKPELILQAGPYQMAIGSGVKQTTLGTVLRVISIA